MQHMRNFLALILVVLGANIPSMAAAPETSPVPEVNPPGRDIEALVRELSDESFRVREKATRDLWELGERAAPALKQAVESSDPERFIRASELLRKIQLHITPGTDPAVMLLVERYAKASPTERTALLAKMIAKRAWRQMLKLYASETNAEVREKLQPAVNGIAVKAARERLLGGDAQEAREFLEMAPVNADSLLALAEFHRSHGSLEQELQRARAIKGRKSEIWQIALQRAAGNLEAARDAALAAGETRIAAAMSALMGDPLPWLREVTNLDEDANLNPVSVCYAAAATKRWMGQKIRTADLEPLRQAVSVRNSPVSAAAMNAMFLLGQSDLAETAFVKSAPLSAFRHFESLERIPEALKALEIDPDQPDYKAWVEKRMKKIEAEDIEDQQEPSEHDEELVALANFLERRGLHEAAFEAFGGALAALGKKDDDLFIGFLSQLFGNRETLSGAPLLAKRAGLAWAGDDERRWDALVTAAFGDDDPASDWWSWLAELAPRANHAERFDGMLALFGLGTDPMNLRAKWLTMAWKAVEKTPPAERAKLLERISALSVETGNVTDSLKAWDQIPEGESNQVFWGVHILNLSAVDRWQEVAKIFLDQIAQVTEPKQDVSPHFHAYAAAALRQVGRLEEAAVHDQWVNQLALGSASIAIQIGNGYAFGRDYKRAAEWWARAAREADPDSSEFAIALKLHSDVQLEDGKWIETAAASEVLARIYLSSDYRATTPLPLIRQRLQADMARAISNLKTDRKASIEILRNCHRAFASDGSLADFFFPALRKVGLIKEHDEWFGETWALMEKIIDLYPECDNSRNTAAWFASRAVRNLDEAEKHLTKALASNPDQSAYLDTMGEIQFARGNREKALEWSRIAVNFLPGDSQLRRQQERFRSAPFPE